MKEVSAQMVESIGRALKSNKTCLIKIKEDKNMLKRVWESKRKYQPTRLEERQYKDGSLHYSLVTAFRSIDVLQDDKDYIIKSHNMTEKTKEYKIAGWIA